MTDGIIQQVIKKWIDKGYSTDPLAWELRMNILPILQQELIEKIKQEFGECDCHHKQRLIGDNKE